MPHADAVVQEAAKGPSEEGGIPGQPEVLHMRVDFGGKGACSRIRSLR